MIWKPIWFITVLSEVSPGLGQWLACPPLVATTWVQSSGQISSIWGIYVTRMSIYQNVTRMILCFQYNIMDNILWDTLTLNHILIFRKPFLMEKISDGKTFLNDVASCLTRVGENQINLSSQNLYFLFTLIYISKFPIGIVLKHLFIVVVRLLTSQNRIGLICCTMISSWTHIVSHTAF